MSTKFTEKKTENGAQNLWYWASSFEHASQISRIAVMANPFAFVKSRRKLHQVLFMESKPDYG